MRQGRRRTPLWLALLAVVFMWTSADGARRADVPAPRAPADSAAVPTVPPQHAAPHTTPTPELP